MGNVCIPIFWNSGGIPLQYKPNTGGIKLNPDFPSCLFQITFTLNRGLSAFYTHICREKKTSEMGRLGSAVMMNCKPWAGNYLGEEVMLLVLGRWRCTKTALCLLAGCTSKCPFAHGTTSRVVHKCHCCCRLLTQLNSCWKYFDKGASRSGK